MGLNPVRGDGSGFIYRDSSGTSLKGSTFGVQPSSGGGRNNLCTCECKASAAGVGCSGGGGINFRYGSLLSLERGSYTGQMQALQLLDDGTELNFLGTDTRAFPGGPATYAVACTQQGCGDAFAGNFRQPNGAVSCAAALAEDQTDPSACAYRCSAESAYSKWLEYCNAPTDTSKETGFHGWGK